MRIWNNIVFGGYADVIDNKKRMKETRSYEVEFYAVFKNVDESILKLNPILRKDGYEFVSFNLSEIEEYFSSLYSLPSKYETKHLVDVGEGTIISHEFHMAYQNHPLGGISFKPNPKNIFLKRISNFDQTVIDNAIQLNDTMEIAGEVQKFKNDLVRKLRFFKNGDIFSPVQFQIEKKSRHIGSKLLNRILKPPTNFTYFIDDIEIKLALQHLGEKYVTTDLTKSAELYFESSYDFFDSKVRFINLMTALESLFNRSKDQISHIIARHLSLIISSDKIEFETNYKRIKKLYGLRSQIVHGQNVNFKESITEATNELQNLTRSAILYCMKLQMTKDDFFKHMNSKGF